MNTPGLNSRTSVLVVGAGPVGLTAALALRERGIDVRVIDEQAGEEKRTYPAVLHPRTLRSLDRWGVVAPLEWRGHAITQLGIHTEGRRRAVLNLPAAGRTSPGAMTLPQDVLRQALMRRLSELGVQVEWKTRLVALAQTEDQVHVSLVRHERVEGEAPQRHREWFDVESATVDTDFLIGADGARSVVREKLGVRMVPRGPRQIFAFFDAIDRRAGSEAQLVVHESQGNTVYPLQSDVSRFSFQVSVATSQAPGPVQLRQLLSARMPWYSSNVEHLEWSGSAEFHPALAERFGEGRVWLAGDAAHSMGPLGAQSINVGVHEASELARRIAEAKGRDAALFGGAYARQCLLEWQVLFGIGSSSPDTSKAPDWVKRNLTVLLQALPAAGDDLDDLLDQLHLAAA